MLSSNLVYGLRDPDTGFIRYVGQTTLGLKRPYGYMKEYRRRGLLKHNPHLHYWLRQLSDRQLNYEVDILEETASLADLNSAEIKWIARLRRAGHPLVNLREGGDCGGAHSPQTRERLAEASRSYWSQAGARAQQSSRARKQFSSQGARDQMSEIKAEQSKDPALRQRVSLATRTAMRRPEVQAKMSAASKRRWADPEERKVLLEQLRRAREAAKRNREARESA